METRSLDEKPGKEKPDINEKSIVDIALVTYLSCQAFKIIRIDKTRDKFKSYFIFENTTELNQAILRFFNKEATVEPNKYHETLRNLKSFARQA